MPQSAGPTLANAHRCSCPDICPPPAHAGVHTQSPRLHAEANDIHPVHKCRTPSCTAAVSDQLPESSMKFRGIRMHNAGLAAAPRAGSPDDPDSAATLAATEKAK